MSKKKLKQHKGKKKQQSVVNEAWENMNEDFARFLPSFISDKLQGGKKNLWFMVVVAVVELVVLGVVVKLLYDWFVS